MTILTALMRLPKELIEMVLILIEDEELLVKLCSYPQIREIIQDFSFQQQFAGIKSLKSREGKSEMAFVAGGNARSWSFAYHDFSNYNSRNLSPSPSNVYFDNETHYCNGLVATGSSRRICLLNPSNGRSRLLPCFSEAKDRGRIRTLLGFSKTGQYKIVGMHSESKEKNFPIFTSYSLFTLKKDHAEEEWRSVECTIPHFPMSRPICSKEGIMYYSGYFSTKDLYIIHLDLDTMQFRSNKIPAPSKFGILFAESDPFQMGDKICISFCDYFTDRCHNVWILEDSVTNVWSMMKLYAPSAMEKEKYFLRFDGFCHSGNMVFTSQKDDKMVMVVSQKETNLGEMLVIDSVRGNKFFVCFKASPSIMFQ